MPSVAEISVFLNDFAPLRLAADWDNVGLLIGDESRAVDRVMTCLTVTPASVAEAVRDNAELIITHHPFPFQPLRAITTADPAGRMLRELIGSNIAVYSPHTAFDSAAAGINQQLAEGIGLADIRPLMPDASDPQLGVGRCGRVARGTSLEGLASRLKQFLHIRDLQIVGKKDKEVTLAAIACGSGADLLDAALGAGCDCFITGEARFHACLEAEARGAAMLLTGHYASERFALERLAETLAEKFPSLEVWASRDEADPLCRL